MVIFNESTALFNSQKRYDLIIADPPWKYTRDTTGLSGCVTNRAGDGTGYLTMADADIAAMPVRDISEKNSVLCLWVTGARFDSGIDIMRAWGFTYKTVLFVWLKTGSNGKDRIIMGNYTRPSTEFVLLGTRGTGIKIPPADKIHTIRQVQRAPIEGHSRKPAKFLRLIEQQFHTAQNKLEMFARIGYPGWDLFGNEAEYQGVLLK